MPINIGIRAFDEVCITVSWIRKFFSSNYTVSVICVSIGNCNQQNIRLLSQESICNSIWISTWQRTWTKKATNISLNKPCKSPRIEMNSCDEHSSFNMSSYSLNFVHTSISQCCFYIKFYRVFQALIYSVYFAKTLDHHRQSSAMKSFCGWMGT